MRHPSLPGWSACSIFGGIAGALLAGAAPLAAQADSLVEHIVPPGANFDKAEFRMWIPAGTAPVRGIVVLVPGSNGDGRSMVADSGWRRLAVERRLALIGCRFTDKTHEQSFIEEYIAVSRGSGQALLTAIDSLAAKVRRPEIVNAPLFLWGMSAGGQFNYEFVAWKPERVAAFVVNKGGIYYSALLPKAARDVPGLLFIGGKDLAFRTNTIVGLFAVNRRGGALWALVEEPDAGHVVARSREMGIAFFDDVVARRVADGGSLRPMAERDGWLGDLTAKTVQPVGDSRAPAVPTAWLPSQAIAELWRSVVTGQPGRPMPWP